MIQNMGFTQDHTSEYIPLAIPIPQKQKHKETSSYPKTPSLQSILDQKYRSGSLKSNDGSNSVTSTVSSCSSFESCDDSHPLDYFDNTWEDIDENFFNKDATNDNKFELLKPIETPEHVVSKKASFVSNLSSSIKNFTQSTVHNNNNLLFDIQPRLTDDKIPKTTVVTQDNIMELKTFKMTSEPDLLTSRNSQISIIKPRESRINPQFLRLYSYEASSRQKGLLSEISSQDEENFIHLQNKLLYHHQQRDPKKEFALAVRQRLWQCVVLPPRDDINIHSPHYIYTGDLDPELDPSSLIRKQQDIKPWITLEDEKNTTKKILKPCGVLNNDVQFTVKGWCNERWLPQA